MPAAQLSVRVPAVGDAGPVFGLFHSTRFSSAVKVCNFISSEHTQAVCAVVHAAGDVSRLALHEACAVVAVVCDCGSWYPIKL